MGEETQAWGNQGRRRGRRDLEAADAAADANADAAAACRSRPICICTYTHSAVAGSAVIYIRRPWLHTCAKSLSEWALTSL